jgi:hypothetical protein
MKAAVPINGVLMYQNVNIANKLVENFLFLFTKSNFSQSNNFDFRIRYKIKLFKTLNLFKVKVSNC